MSDMGWQYDGDGRWELADQHGGVVAVMPRTMLEAGRLGEVNAYAARRWWPPLVADPSDPSGGRPWVHCVLSGGPADGAHHWLDPREHGEAPPVLLIAVEQPLPGMPPGPPPDMAVALPPARYARRPQVCGHGHWCGWPYRFEPGGDGAGVV